MKNETVDTKLPVKISAAKSETFAGENPRKNGSNFNIISWWEKSQANYNCFPDKPTTNSQLPGNIYHPHHLVTNDITQQVKYNRITITG